MDAARLSHSKTWLCGGGWWRCLWAISKLIPEKNSSLVILDYCSFKETLNKKPLSCNCRYNTWEEKRPPPAPRVDIGGGYWQWHHMTGQTHYSTWKDSACLHTGHLFVRTGNCVTREKWVCWISGYLKRSCHKHRFSFTVTLVPKWQLMKLHQEPKVQLPVNRTFWFLSPGHFHACYSFSSLRNQQIKRWRVGSTSPNQQHIVM